MLGGASGGAEFQRNHVPHTRVNLRNTANESTVWSAIGGWRIGEPSSEGSPCGHFGRRQSANRQSPWPVFCGSSMCQLNLVNAFTAEHLGELQAMHGAPIVRNMAVSESPCARWPRGIATRRSSVAIT